MFSSIVSFIKDLIRNNGMVFGFGAVLFGTYTGVDISFGGRPDNASVLIGLGLFALIAAIWGLVGYAISAAIRWVASHLHKGHHVHH